MVHQEFSDERSSCENCRWLWRDTYTKLHGEALAGKLRSYGECRRHPPRVIGEALAALVAREAVEHEEGRSSGEFCIYTSIRSMGLDATIFPSVSEEDFCGEWEPKSVVTMP